MYVALAILLWHTYFADDACKSRSTCTGVASKNTVTSTAISTNTDQSFTVVNFWNSNDVMFDDAHVIMITNACSSL